MPSAFTACSRDSWWCNIAYWATESAGKIGTVAILVITCFFYTIRIESKRRKVLIFLKTFLVLGALLSGIAFLNEHVTKELLAITRPSHEYIVRHKPSDFPLDSIYKLDEAGRKNMFRKIILSDTITYQTFDPRIVNHWIEESGYSFPSGHSFNAFILAVIMSFSLYHARSTFAQKLYILPLAWALLVAVSRVAIGAHSALDVSFGAALGLIIGHLFLYIDFTREIITKRDQ